MNVNWQIEWDNDASKQFLKLGKPTQIQIQNYLENRLAKTIDPQDYGKPLAGKLRGLWRYRVGDYRIICKIEKRRLVVLVVTVGHRSRVYE